MPVPIQNIMVSLKGFQLNRTRKRGAYVKYKQQINARKNWSTSQFETYQLEQLNKVMSYAVKNIPHYQRTIDSDFSKLENISALGNMPLLPREKVRSNPNDFRPIGASKQIIVHTTGTTGSPLNVYCDADSRQKNYAYFDAYLESLGLNTSARHIIIGGRVVVHPDSITPPFWRESKFQNSLLMSSYHLNDNLIDYYINKITDYQPEYIESYPSAIYLIAKHMLIAGRQLKIKAIVTSAETLFRDQRETIEKVFQCKVYDQYGCAEMCLFVGQCLEGKYHVRPDYGCVEIVDDSGNLLPLGETGNVVCTGFVNQQMPLIRYAIGDCAIMDTNQSCNCGLHTPIIKEIIGRKDDVLVTGDGRKVGRMSPVLKGLPVKAAQYIQNVEGEVIVNIIPGDAFDSKHGVDAVIESVKLRLGKKTKIQVNLVKKLVRGRGGKLKSVISTLLDK